MVKTRKHGMASMVAMQELEGWMDPAEMKELGDWKGRKDSRQDHKRRKSFECEDTGRMSTSGCQTGLVLSLRQIWQQVQGLRQTCPPHLAP